MAGWASAGIAATPSIAPHYAELPLAFERQGDAAEATYVTRGEGYAISLHDGNAVIGIQAGQGGASGAVSMEFVDGRRVNGSAGGELPGKVNIIRGNDPRQWRLGLPTFGRVTYEGIYPGVDVVYYGNWSSIWF